ncbi:MAG: glycerol-3-phosphate 1-O-acyltransferase PlsY [Proteobacteria bacterium]|nr:glycerol-3-phosphate 1-O-acyltransferase PlsY [Burkholderiales bacterium]
MLDAMIVLAAYLIGSVSFAVLVSRWFGLPDPRSYGSKNPGATNVLRSGRKAAAVVTLAGDGLKGWAAVALAQWFAPQHGFTDTTIALVAVAVFVGHLYPVFFGFVGGKGVATAAGVLLALNAWLALVLLVLWLILAVGLKLSSLAALAATAAALPLAWWLQMPRVYLVAIALMGALLVWRHRSNIRKLLAGTESGFGSKAP